MKLRKYKSDMFMFIFDNAKLTHVSSERFGAKFWGSLRGGKLKQELGDGLAHFLVHVIMTESMRWGSG
jgi:hypothetical protein